MTRRPRNLTSLAIALKAASLLAVLAGVLGILVSDLAGQRAGLAQVEAPIKVQLHSEANLK